MDSYKVICIAITDKVGNTREYGDILNSDELGERQLKRYMEDGKQIKLVESKKRGRPKKEASKEDGEKL